MKIPSFLLLSATANAESAPRRWATCSDEFITYTPFQAILEPERDFTPSCEVARAEPYRVQVQVECNFEKVRAAPYAMEIINSETLNMRSWNSGLYQFFIGNPYAGHEVELFGDDVRSGYYLFFSDGDCTEGEYMDILVEQWIAEDGKTKRQLYIDDVLRIDLTSDVTLNGNVAFSMAYTYNEVYTLSTLDVRHFTLESYRPLPTPPARTSTCETTLIGDIPFKSSDINEAVTLTPECAESNNEAYRVKVKVECNFDKIDALPWGKTSHLISGEMLTLRAGQSGNPSNPTHWFQLFVGRPNSGIDVIVLGDDIRSSGALLTSK